jgi:hypothetical protein
MGTERQARATAQTEAALRGLANALAQAPDPALLLTPLACIGDALRLGIEISTPVRAWSDALGRAEVEGALGALLDETATWGLSEVSAAYAASDPSFAFSLRRRDEAESVLHAVRRICLPKGLALDELTALAALDTALSFLDMKLASLVSRAEVGRLLGTRAAIGPDWADGFEGSERGQPDEHDEAVEERWPESIRLTVPSDEAITRFVTRGAMRWYVEGVAAANEDFAEDLARCIDALLDARETVGLDARRWRKGARVAPARDPLRFASIPAVRLAAATAPEVEAPTTTLELGTLSPIEAEGRFVVSAREVRLQVFEGPKRIECIELGDRITTSPASPGRWEIVTPIPSGEVRLRIVAVDGSELTEALSFEPVDSDDEAR